MAKIKATDSDKERIIDLISGDKFCPGDLISGIIDVSTGKDGKCIRVELTDDERFQFDHLLPWGIDIGHEIYTGILRFRKRIEEKEPEGFHWECRRNGILFFETFSSGK